MYGGRYAVGIIYDSVWVFEIFKNYIVIIIIINNNNNNNNNKNENDHCALPDFESP